MYESSGTRSASSQHRRSSSLTSLTGIPPVVHTEDPHGSGCPGSATVDRCTPARSISRSWLLAVRAARTSAGVGIGGTRVVARAAARSHAVGANAEIWRGTSTVDLSSGGGFDGGHGGKEISPQPVEGISNHRSCLCRKSHIQVSFQADRHSLAHDASGYRPRRDKPSWTETTPEELIRDQGPHLHAPSCSW